MGCIFCDIVAKTAPASIIYEDEHTLAFMDLFPMRPGHALVIPKTHACFVSELNSEQRSRLFDVGEAILAAHKKTDCDIKGHNLVINDGPVANQHVPHVHLHVIPRKKGDLPKTLFSFASRYMNYFGMEARRRELDKAAETLRRGMQI